jgi:hypothetical protein
VRIVQCTTKMSPCPTLTIYPRSYAIVLELTPSRQHTGCSPSMLPAWGELEHDGVRPWVDCQSWTWGHFCRAAFSPTANMAPPLMPAAAELQHGPTIEHLLPLEPRPLHLAPSMLPAWGELEHDGVRPWVDCQSWTWGHSIDARRGRTSAWSHY